MPPPLPPRYVHNFIKYEFDFRFDIPATYPAGEAAGADQGWDAGLPVQERQVSGGAGPQAGGHCALTAGKPRGAFDSARPGRPAVAPEIELPELEGKTAKMYRGGKICLTIHFKPLWAKNRCSQALQGLPPPAAWGRCVRACVAPPPPTTALRCRCSVRPWSANRAVTTMPGGSHGRRRSTPALGHCLLHCSPHFGVAHALCLGLAPWMAAEIPYLVEAGAIQPKV